MENGSQYLTTGHQKIVSLLGSAQEGSKAAFLYEPKIQGTGPKWGRMLYLVESSAVILPMTSEQGLPLLGENTPGNYFIQALLPLGFVWKLILPSQPSEISLQKGLWIARRSSTLFFAISAVHGSFPYKTYGKLFSAEQFEWREKSQIIFPILKIVEFNLHF